MPDDLKMEQLNVKFLATLYGRHFYEYEINNLEIRKSERSLMEIVYDVCCCWDVDKKQLPSLLETIEGQ